jgi:hypothetical protein
MASPVNHFLCSAPACSLQKSKSDGQTEVKPDVPFESVAAQVEAAAAPPADRDRVEQGVGPDVSKVEDSDDADDAATAAGVESIADQSEYAIADDRTESLADQQVETGALSPEQTVAAAVDGGVQTQVVATQSEASADGSESDQVDSERISSVDSDLNANLGEWSEGSHDDSTLENAAVDDTAEVARVSDRIDATGTLQSEMQFAQTQSSKEPLAGTLSLEALLQEAPPKESIRDTGAVIKDAIRSSLQLDGKTVQLELHPAELGMLKIQVTQVDHNIETRIIATEFATSELLLNHRDQLMEALAELGFQSSDVDISHEDSSFDQSKDEGQSKDSPQQSKTKNTPAARLETQSSVGLNLIV